MGGGANAKTTTTPTAGGQTGGTTPVAQGDVTNMQQTAGNQATNQMLRGCRPATLVCEPGSELVLVQPDTSIGIAVHSLVQSQYGLGHRSALNDGEFIFTDEGFGRIYQKTDVTDSRTRLRVLDTALFAAIGKERNASEAVAGNFKDRPDILDDSDDTVYEIKPCQREQQGRGELAHYFSVLGQAPTKVPQDAAAPRRGRNWQPGGWVPPDYHDMSGDMTYQVLFELAQRGLILYTIWGCRKKKEDEDQPHDQPFVFDYLDTDLKPEAKTDVGEGDESGKSDGEPGKSDGEPIYEPGHPIHQPDRPIRPPVGIDARAFAIALAATVVIAAIIYFTPVGWVLGALRIAGVLFALLSGDLAFAAGGGGGGGGGGKGGEGAKGTEGATEEGKGTGGTGGTTTGAGKTGEPGKGTQQGKSTTQTAPGGTQEKGGKTGKDTPVAESVRKLMEVIKQLSDPNGDPISEADAEKILALGEEFLKQLQAADPHDPNATKLKDLAANMLPLVQDARKKITQGKGKVGGGKPGAPPLPEGKKAGDPNQQGDPKKQGDPAGGGTTGQGQAKVDPKSTGKGKAGGQGKGDQARQAKGGKGGGAGGGKGAGIGKKKADKTTQSKLVPAPTGQAAQDLVETDGVRISGLSPSLEEGAVRTISLDVGTEKGIKKVTAKVRVVGREEVAGHTVLHLDLGQDMQVEGTQTSLNRNITWEWAPK